MKHPEQILGNKDDCVQEIIWAYITAATKIPGVGFNIDEIVQAWNKMYEAKMRQIGVPSIDWSHCFTDDFQSFFMPWDIHENHCFLMKLEEKNSVSFHLPFSSCFESKFEQLQRLRDCVSGWSSLSRFRDFALQWIKKSCCHGLRLAVAVVKITFHLALFFITAGVWSLLSKTFPVQDIHFMAPLYAWNSVVL
ncbi:hypothetical protein L6452_33011 [Arctium lappa]|uniref:Uncharacterized protein n=1 Tax=Arctium lappa TaxID=4217 RepID=A0ACB8Z7B2_ARCLA|nr:hypothetical protein L6452_33011 [Arctium lappa]